MDKYFGNKINSWRIVGLVFALVMSVYTSEVFATSVAWTNWSSVSPGTPGTASGNIDLGSGNIGVSLNGSVYDFDPSDKHFNNIFTGYVSPLGTYGGLMPSGLIKENSIGSVTLDFTGPIVNPYFALVSVGQTLANQDLDIPVTYTFTSDVLIGELSILHSGPNEWGPGTGFVDGNIFKGAEFNGVLQLQGTYNSITISFGSAETWHGFNVGAAVPTDPVPEPATMLLFGSGLIGLAGLRGRNKRRSMNGS